MSENDRRHDLGAMTTDELEGLLAGGEPVVVLVPVGSVEPHGPHLPLVTDTIISQASAGRAAALLSASGVGAVVAPAVAYGVTNCAAAFKGAVTVEAEALSRYLRSMIDGFLRNGFSHVCLINNHLEPDHDVAVRAAAAGVEAGRVSVACPLTRRWARTLSAEFKSGACHAGKYETSIVLSAQRGLVREGERDNLPEVPISLAEKLRAGIPDFVDMGLTRAYAGDPASATAAHGDEQLDLLAQMIVSEIQEALASG